MIRHYWPGVRADIAEFASSAAHEDSAVAANRSQFDHAMDDEAPQNHASSKRRERELARKSKRVRGFMRELGPLLAVLATLALIGLWSRM